MKKLQTDTNLPEYYKSMTEAFNNKSVDEIVERMLSESRPEYSKEIITIPPPVDFNNDDFLNAFDGRNTNCVQYLNNVGFSVEINLKNKNYFDLKMEYKDTRQEKSQTNIEPTKQPQTNIEPQTKQPQTNQPQTNIEPQTKQPQTNIEPQTKQPQTNIEPTKQPQTKNKS